MVRESHLDFENGEVVLQMELLRSDSRPRSLIIPLGAVHTGDESLQDRLRDVQTCGTILALAYVLYHPSTMWS